jgi:hypothetical protein
MLVNKHSLPPVSFSWHWLAQNWTSQQNESGNCWSKTKWQRHRTNNTKKPVSAGEKLVLFQKTVCRHFQIERCWALVNPTRDGIVWTMARAKPTTKVSCVGEWDAAKVSAHANDNEPLRVFDTLCNINTVRQLDEDGLAPPLNSYCGERVHSSWWGRTGGACPRPWAAELSRFSPSPMLALLGGRKWAYGTRPGSGLWAFAGPRT